MGVKTSNAGLIVRPADIQPEVSVCELLLQPTQVVVHDAGASLSRTLPLDRLINIAQFLAARLALVPQLTDVILDTIPEFSYVADASVGDELFTPTPSGALISLRGVRALVSYLDKNPDAGREPVITAPSTQAVAGAKALFLFEQKLLEELAATLAVSHLLSRDADAGAWQQQIVIEKAKSLLADYYTKQAQASNRNHEARALEVLMYRLEVFKAQSQWLQMAEYLTPVLAREMTSALDGYGERDFVLYLEERLLEIYVPFRGDSPEAVFQRLGECAAVAAFASAHAKTMVADDISTRLLHSKTKQLGEMAKQSFNRVLQWDLEKAITSVRLR